MRIAILTSGSPNDKKGSFNSTHQHIKRLIDKKIEADVFIIRYYDSWLAQIIRKKKFQKVLKESFFVYDNIKYNNLWVPLTLSDYAQWQKLNQLGSVFTRHAKKWSKLFGGYELISAHSFEPGIVARYAKEQFDVPFTVTWHGSEIHTMPKMNSAVKSMVLKICRDASANFFVSKQLQTDAVNLGADITKSTVLYNAIDSEQFKPYTAGERTQLKASKKIDGAINIGFMGNLVAVKNSQLLPEIFKAIADEIKNAKFYFVGDGKFRPMLESRCKELNLHAVFMGNRQQDEMPALINCFDLVVLPSKNEGMPLIVLECLSCKVPIIASRVGGIPEVLDEQYTIEHGPEFVERFAKAAVNVLKDTDRKNIALLPIFNWETTIEKEIGVYREILNKN